MRHVSSPVLRRLVDEPIAVPDDDRRHLVGCDRCQAAGKEAASDAAFASRALCAPDNIADIDLEWLLLQEKLRAPEWARQHRRAAFRDPWRLPRRLSSVSLGTGTAVAAGVLVIGVGTAAALTTVYAPTKVAPLTVSTADLNAISSLTGLGNGNLATSGSRQLPFGELTWTTSSRPEQVSSFAAARALTHLAFPTPAHLPAGVGSPSIMVQPQVTATVRFNTSAGSGVGGSTLQVTLGPGIAVQYGGTTGGTGGNSLTTLAIAAMQRPVATSDGATASQLETFLLSQPGVPSGLAQELRLLGNPGTTLPVPVPSGMTSQQLKIGGAPAVLVEAPSDVASGVIWETPNGVVHGVGGLLDQEDVLSVARQIG
jgi:hypothetical protein